VSVAHYETLQDKLAQLKDARDALNVLRDEHREKRRREQEELERLRQIQMAQKLEVLRQKKQVSVGLFIFFLCLVFAYLSAFVYLDSLCLSLRTIFGLWEQSFYKLDCS